MQPPEPFNPSLPPRSTPIGQPESAPGWGAVPPPPPGPPVPPYAGMLPPAQRMHGLATAAMVCGIVGLVTFWFFGIVPLLALIFGLVSGSAIKKSGGALTGSGRAKAGVILGLIGVVGSAVFLWAVATDRIGTDTDDSRNYLSADVGDCIDTIPQAAVIRTLDFVACTASHEAEVYASGELNSDRDRSFPGETTVLTEVEQACYDAFEPYIGRSYETSVFEVYYLYPQALSWNGDRGAYVCMVFEEGKRSTSSARQSNR